MSSDSLDCASIVILIKGFLSFPVIRKPKVCFSLRRRNGVMEYFGLHMACKARWKSSPIQGSPPVTLQRDKGVSDNRRQDLNPTRVSPVANAVAPATWWPFIQTRLRRVWATEAGRRGPVKHAGRVLDPRAWTALPTLEVSAWMNKQ
eukprot:282473-Amorphochlora_amoeboformis.AAC.2